MARFDINADDLAIEAQFNAGFAVETVRTQRHPIFGGTSGKIVLGQVRSIDRCRGITAQHDDAAAKLPPPKHLGRSKSRRAAADDDNSVRRTSQRLAARLPLFKFLMNEDPAVLLLDPPAGKRVYGRRANGFAGAKIETGVMPGATDAVPDYEPFSERPVVMGATGSDGENLGPAMYQQDLLVAGPSTDWGIMPLWQGPGLRQRSD
jgi:hypothetical protein